MIGTTKRLPEELHVPVWSRTFSQREEKLIETAMRYVLQQKTGWTAISCGPQERDKMRVGASLDMGKMVSHLNVCMHV